MGHMIGSQAVSPILSCYKYAWLFVLLIVFCMYQINKIVQVKRSLDVFLTGCVSGLGPEQECCTLRGLYSVIRGEGGRDLSAGFSGSRG